MKNNLRMMIVFAALGLILSCTAVSFGQDKEPITGGYQNVEVSAAQIVSAANFAVKAQAKKQRAKIKLIEIKKAEQQVVAGMNFNMCLQVETRDKRKKTSVPQTVQAIVFLNLKQKYELTSWAIAACAEEKPPEMPVK